MKVKSILKTSSASRIEIIAEVAKKKFVTWYVDYTIGKDYHDCEGVLHKVSFYRNVPEDILSMEVTDIDAFEDTLQVYAWLK